MQRPIHLLVLEVCYVVDCINYVSQTVTEYKFKFHSYLLQVSWRYLCFGILLLFYLSLNSQLAIFYSFKGNFCCCCCYNPAIPLLEIYPNKIKSAYERVVCSPTFSAAQFTTANSNITCFLQPEVTNTHSSKYIILHGKIWLLLQHFSSLLKKNVFFLLAIFLNSLQHGMVSLWLWMESMSMKK